MSKTKLSILFLGKHGDAHAAKAQAFLKRNCEHVAAFEVQRRSPLSDDL